jgi:hypothetical protein
MESPLRELILQMLEQDGYTVLDAANAIQAPSWRQDRPPVDGRCDAGHE